MSFGFLTCFGEASKQKSKIDKINTSHKGGFFRDNMLPVERLTSIVPDRYKDKDNGRYFLDPLLSTFDPRENQVKDLGGFTAKVAPYWRQGTVGEMEQLLVEHDLCFPTSGRGSWSIPCAVIDCCYAAPGCTYKKPKLENAYAGGKVIHPLTFVYLITPYFKGGDPDELGGILAEHVFQLPQAGQGRRSLENAIARYKADQQLTGESLEERRQHNRQLLPKLNNRPPVSVTVFSS